MDPDGEDMLRILLTSPQRVETLYDPDEIFTGEIYMLRRAAGEVVKREKQELKREQSRERPTAVYHLTTE